MKRIAMSALALMLTVSLIACSQQTPESSATESQPASQASSESSAAESSAQPASGEKVDVSYWCMFSGGDGDIMTAMVDKYNSEDNKANIEMTILKSEEYYSKLITAMATQDAADVTVSHISSLTEFVQDDYLYPLDDLAAGIGLDWGGFSNSLNEGITFDSKHVAVPLDTHVFLMHYNTEMLGGMGLMDENNNPTYAQNKEAFVEYFNNVKGQLPSGSMPISGTSQGELPIYLWYTLYTQQDGKLISDDGKTATLDNEKNLNALNYMMQLVNEEIWPKNQQNGGQIFTAKQAAATFNGNWGIPLFEKTEGLEFISLPFPQLFEKQSVYADSHTFVMPRQKTDDAAKQEAGMDFMNWMTDNAIMWAEAGHIPSKSAIVASDEFKALPYRSAYAQSADYATFYPKTTIITGMKESFKNIFASMISGAYSAEEAQALMQEEVQRLLDA